MVQVQVRLEAHSTLRQQQPQARQHPQSAYMEACHPQPLLLLPPLPGLRRKTACSLLLLLVVAGRGPCRHAAVGCLQQRPALQAAS
jgi:hypothetical protein